MNSGSPASIADYLDNEETIAEFLKAALEDENPEVVLAAIAAVAKARGMTDQVAILMMGRAALDPSYGLAISPNS